MLISFYEFMTKLFEHNKRQRKSFIKNYKTKKYKYLKHFTKETDLSYEYMKKKAYNKHNKLYIYSIQTTQYTYHTSKQRRNQIRIDYTPNNIAGALLYRVIMQTTTKKRIYIPLVSILHKFRGLGYGILLLNDLINHFSLTHPTKKLEIVLLSLPKTVSFYKTYGFVEGSSKYIEKHEVLEDGEQILVYTYSP